MQPATKHCAAFGLLDDENDLAHGERSYPRDGRSA
jgi:hypothetical protein